MASPSERLERLLAEDPVLAAAAEHFGDTACWVAGGWIRDRAIGRTPPDLDLVVAGDSLSAADPAQRLARAHGVRAHLLGRPPRAVWRVHSESLRAEIWPLGDLTPEEDVARRDFTCNSMLWKLPKGPLMDPCQGLRDIQATLIRAVSRENLMADPVRLLRGPRFVASLPGFRMESQTASWTRDLVRYLEKAPRERLGAELYTMARAPRASVGFMLAHDLEVLFHAGPRKHYEPDLVALERLTGRLPHPVAGALRAAGSEAILAWLVAAWGVRTANRLAPYAWTRPTVQYLLRAATSREAFIQGAAMSPADRREMISSAGDAFPIVVALAAAMDPGSKVRAPAWGRWWRQWLRSGSTILETRAPLPAEEVATILGLQPGPALGQALGAMQRAVLRREVRSAGGARRWLNAYSGGV